MEDYIFKGERLPSFFLKESLRKIGLSMLNVPDKFPANENWTYEKRINLNVDDLKAMSPVFKSVMA